MFFCDKDNVILLFLNWLTIVVLFVLNVLNMTVHQQAMNVTINDHILVSVFFLFPLRVGFLFPFYNFAPSLLVALSQFSVLSVGLTHRPSSFSSAMSGPADSPFHQAIADFQRML